MNDVAIYADHASTSLPVLFPPATDEWQWGNASNTHALGRAAHQELDHCRAQIERALNVPTGGGKQPRIVFTSGATESNNMVLRNILGVPWDFIATTATEHSSVHFTVQFLAARGVDVVYLPVDPMGRVDPTDVARVLGARPHAHGLVSLMLVNNEIGTVQDLAAVAAVVQQHNSRAGRRVWLHTDATQAPGHVPVDVASLGVDFLSLSAHKFHGPTGIGLLYCAVVDAPEAPRYSSMLLGGHQQGGLRPGTESVPLARAMTRALQDATASPALAQRGQHLRRLSRMVWDVLTAFVVMGHVLPTGPAPETEGRAPHHVSFCVRNARREDLVAFLERRGVLVSGGSACSSESGLPSHVLVALGVPGEYQAGSVRITFSHTNTEEEVQRHLCPALFAMLSDVVARYEHQQQQQQEATAPTTQAVRSIR